LQSYYDYDGPIYTYSNLLPDEVIANVQTSLQDAGYYYGPITGSLSVDTRAAIANFQRDYGLPITGAIDEPTVEALGLYQTDDSYNFQNRPGLLGPVSLVADPTRSAIGESRRQSWASPRTEALAFLSQVPPTTPKFSRQCGAIDSQLRQTTVSRGSNRIQQFRASSREEVRIRLIATRETF